MIYVLNLKDNTFKTFEQEMCALADVVCQRDLLWGDELEVIDWPGDTEPVRMFADKFIEQTRARIEEWVDIAEELGWHVEEGIQDGAFWFEFFQSSPAGEDFSFTIWPAEVGSYDVSAAIVDYDFNVEEHVHMWLEAKKHGVDGVPDVDTLVEDAKDILHMIDDLYVAIRNIAE